MNNFDLQEYISRRIRMFRKQKGFSQEKLSELAGLGSKAVQNIEGQRYDFKVQTISKILDALEVSAEEFFEFSISSQNQNLLIELIESLNHLTEIKQESILKSFVEILNNITD